MLVKEQCMEIDILHRQGKSNRQIAKELGISRNTVKKYLTRLSDPNYARKSNKITKLIHYHDYLKKRIEAASPDWLPATVLFSEIKASGYTGKITQLRNYLHSLKPKSKPDPIIRFETKPGEQMQVDWGEFKMGTVKLHAFIAILGYSRMTYVQFTDNEKVETLIECLQNAFEYFGGTVQTVLFDNMRTVVTKRDAYAKNHHQFQDLLWDYAKHIGFLPKLCKPYRAKTKGKVERFVGYLRFSFFNPLRAKFKQNGLQLDTFLCNQAIETWLIEVANVRTHASLKEKPFQRWLLEKPYLQPLAPRYAGLSSKETRIKEVYPPPVGSLIDYQTTFLQHPISIYTELQLNTEGALI